MRDSVKFILILIFFSLLIADHCLSYDPASSEPDVALWLARSCIGEAGFESSYGDECATLLHIYKKRTVPSRLSLYRVLRIYSGALKNRKGHPNKWVFDLSRDGEEPRLWPKTAKWDKVREKWLNTLDLCDSFLRGEVEDPFPDADHYGSIYDHFRAVERGWYWLKGTGTRNRLYSIRKPRDWKKWERLSRN